MQSMFEPQVFTQPSGVVLQKAEDVSIDCIESSSLVPTQVEINDTWNHNLGRILGIT